MQNEPSEEQQQIEFVNWIHRTHPEAWMVLHHSPNGGHRSKLTGHKMKLMGTKKGFPDLVVYHARGKFAGLAIEMKTRTGRVSTEQLEWKDRLTRCGFDCYVARGIEDAKAIFSNYFGQEYKHD